MLQRERTEYNVRDEKKKMFKSPYGGGSRRETDIRTHGAYAREYLLFVQLFDRVTIRLESMYKRVLEPFPVVFREIQSINVYRSA